MPGLWCPCIFYQNEHGSRVFFDDLGPPWPKHPCTDNEPNRLGRQGSSDNTASAILRAAEEKRRALLAGLPKIATDEPIQDDYVAPLHTGDGWDRCVVKKRADRDGVCYFVVYNASDPASKSIRFSTVSRLDLPSAEETLYLKGDRMSFFSFEEFAPQEIEITRKKSKAVSSSRKRRVRRKKRRK